MDQIRIQINQLHAIMAEMYKPIQEIQDSTGELRLYAKELQSNDFTE